MSGAGEPAGPGTHQKYLAAAMDMLNEHGTADPTLGITIKGAAAAAGVNRNTLYRHWETVTDLNHDVARYLACVVPSWEQRVVESPPSTPAGEAVRRAFDTELLGISLAARAAVTAFPLDSSARREISDWERTALDHLGWWLDAHLAEQGLRWVDGATPLVAATGVAACVQGTFVTIGFQYGFTLAEWPDGVLDDLAATVSLLVDELAEPGAPTGGSAVRPATWWQPELTEARAAIIDRIVRAVDAAPFGEPASLVPGRVVDMARLARRLGVSERQLYRMWPTVTDLNGQVLTELLRRLHERTDDVSTEVLGIGLGARYATFEHLLASALQAVVASFISEAQWTPFVNALAVVDPEVRARIPLQLRDHSGVRTIFLAVLAMARWYRRDEVSADRFAEVMVLSVFGMQRVVALNPSLLDESVGFRSADQPLLGMALYFVGTSMATTVPPHLHPSAQHAVAPPITLE